MSHESKVDLEKCFEFGSFSIELESRVLLRDGQDVVLRPKSFDVLAYLVGNAGELSLKDEIIAAVWPDVVASDESLSRCISDIRAAIDDSTKEIIRTVPGRGYKFAADARDCTTSERSVLPQVLGKQVSASAAPRVFFAASLVLSIAAFLIALSLFYGFREVRQPGTKQPSIAVLPFDNISNDPEQAYFADGMAEDIITALSKLSVLFVVERNSSFKYRNREIIAKQIGRDLGVQYLLQGSVRRAGDWVRINARLIDTTTGRNLWAENYDGQLNDVFALQDKVTVRVVEALALNLGATERATLTDHGTTNIEAHDAFLRGQGHARNYTAEGAKLAVEHYTRALEIDPEYKRAAHALEQIRFIEKYSGLK